MLARNSDFRARCLNGGIAGLRQSRFEGYSIRNIGHGAFQIDHLAGRVANRRELSRTVIEFRLFVRSTDLFVSDHTFAFQFAA